MLAWDRSVPSYQGIPSTVCGYSKSLVYFNIMLHYAYNVVIMINIVISIIRHEKPVAQYTLKHVISQLEIQMIRINILVKCIKLSIIKSRKNVTDVNCRNYMFFRTNCLSG